MTAVETFLEPTDSAAPAVTPASRTNWQRRYRLSLIVTDVVVVAIALVCGQMVRLGQPFTGAKRYVAHLNAPGNAYQQLPIPAKAFWSLSMYDSRTALFSDNPLDRYVLNDRSKLRYNADGSLDIYLQHAAPSAADENNWLPAPEGQFQLSGRLYGTGAKDLKKILDGSGWHQAA